MTTHQAATVQAGTDLFNFAIEREDIVWLVEHLPSAASVDRHTLEYELQILKIIGVGWCLAFFMENGPGKMPLLQHYWQAVRELSRTLSQAAGSLAGSEIDYFQVLKKRLDTYRGAMADQPGVRDPLKVIGPEFALACRRPDDVFTIMAGAKMFMSVMTHVRAYLNALAYHTAQE